MLQYLHFTGRKHEPRGNWLRTGRTRIQTQAGFSLAPELLTTTDCRLLTSHPVSLGMQKGREGEQKNHVWNEVDSTSLDWRKEESKVNKVSCMGAWWCQLERQGTFCDFVQEALPVIPDQPYHSDYPDLAHGLLMPVNIVARCFIRVSIGC